MCSMTSPVQTWSDMKNNVKRKAARIAHPELRPPALQAAGRAAPPLSLSRLDVRVLVVMGLVSAATSEPSQASPASTPLVHGAVNSSLFVRRSSARRLCARWRGRAPRSPRSPRRPSACSPCWRCPSTRRLTRSQVSHTR